jgi:curved DNA-binding protein CbpA
MSDYYSILGLTKNASDIEIKTSFRKLVKIYHPDKNPHDPNSKKIFENILKAYNTLINPHTRSRYDNANTTNQTTFKNQPYNHRKRGQKEWSTSDEDLKRKDYYKRHYHQVKSKTTQANPEKKSYNDFKYILFATPIAVGLLMLIITIFSSEPKTEVPLKKPETSFEKPKNNIVQLANGEQPYNSFFGNIITFNTNTILQINNTSAFDAVIAVFDKKNNSYIQHAYLRTSYSVEFSKLPKTGVYWKCILGKNWNEHKILFNDKVFGGFDSTIQYQNWKKFPTVFSKDSVKKIIILNVLEEQSKNKQYISNEIDFFEK